MQVHWTVFQAAGQSVEAQVFSPDSPNIESVILFCPGFPGVGAGIFEQRHAAALVECGYNLIVLRHNGTRLDGPHAPLMVNNAARLMAARKAGQTHLGNGPSTVQDWLLEPLTALKAISRVYKKIIIIGNSFGALSALWSLTSDGADMAQVRHILLMAGAQGIAEEGSPFDAMRIWKPEYLIVPRITDKVSLDPPQNIVATLKTLYRDLPERVKKLPESIRLTYLVVAKDELFNIEDSNRFRTAIGGRGDVVIDTIDRAYPESLLLAHDMPDYPTENLLELLKESS
jgi:hypothetical protein